jgi:acetylornithine deacetylase/succinyl-diaminopimelate desuccinylase-like protein
MIDTTTLDHPALDALAALVRTPSVNPTLAPNEGTGEAAVAEVAAAWLRARGVACRLEEAAPGRPNVVAETGNGGGRTLVLCAHLDTVSTAGMTIPPFEPRLADGRLYGRGSYDMKGGAAAAMAAVATLAREGIAGRVLLALVADEEVASLGAQHFVARYAADACILTEPSEGRLILGHKGFLWAEVETAGRAAHGSRFDLGVSAIAKMGPVVTALERFDREVLRRRVDPLLGPASQHCATIAGGSGLSTYAERCLLRLAELRRVVEAACPDAQVRPLLDRPPLACPADSTIARCVRQAATAITGRPPEEAGVAYWMDAALFAAAGIPTVDYGPAGAGAHEAVEWVDAASVVSCAAVLAEAARRFLADQG